MRFRRFSIDGFDCLSEIGPGALIERTGTDRLERQYELTVTRREAGEAAWLGGYMSRAEFNIEFDYRGQRASGRWRRKEYDGNTAVFISVGDITFGDAPVTGTG